MTKISFCLTNMQCTYITCNLYIHNFPQKTKNLGPGGFIYAVNLRKYVEQSKEEK